MLSLFLHLAGFRIGVPVFDGFRIGAPVADGFRIGAALLGFRIG